MTNDNNNDAEDRINAAYEQFDEYHSTHKFRHMTFIPISMAGHSILNDIESLLMNKLHSRVAEKILISALSIIAAQILSSTIGD